MATLDTTSQLDFSEVFPHLSAAPVVEAVIHWRARAEKEWNLDELRARLANQFPDFPDCQPQHEVQVETKFGAHESATHKRQVRWIGFRLSPKSEPYVSQFNRDGLVFSRLAPYNDWTTFSTEALRHWDIFRENAAPFEVQRLGVRFINRIQIAEIAEIDRYLSKSPSILNKYGLSLDGFLSKNTYNLPGKPYQIAINVTVQPSAPEDVEGIGLIIDIDVSTNRAMDCDTATTSKHLSEMRWLKNKVFFSLLRPTAVKKFTRIKA